jgi:hypothetical protein
VEVRRALLLSLGASPLRQAAEFLLRVAAEASPGLATSAISALGLSRYRHELRERLAATVAARHDAGIAAHFERELR